MTHPVNLTVITPDVMKMAIRLLSGQLKSFQITKDMVGKTLAWTGEMHLLDIDPSLLGGASPAPVKTENPRAAEKPQQAVSAVESAAKNHETYDLILTALQVDPSKPMNVVEIADLIEQDTSYLNKRTLQACVRTTLEKMHKNGVADLKEIDGRKHYAIRVTETV